MLAKSSSWPKRFDMQPNEHGVFMDAERIEVYKGENAYAVVLLVCVDGRHYWGYDLRHSTGAFSGLPRLKTWCETRNDAILSALRVFARGLQDRTIAPRSMLQEIERQIERLTPRQLNLFEI